MYSVLLHLTCHAQLVLNGDIMLNTTDVKLRADIFRMWCLFYEANVSLVAYIMHQAVWRKLKEEQQVYVYPLIAWVTNYWHRFTRLLAYTFLRVDFIVCIYVILFQTKVVAIKLKPPTSGICLQLGS